MLPNGKISESYNSKKLNVGSFYSLGSVVFLDELEKLGSLRTWLLIASSNSLTCFQTVNGFEVEEFIIRQTVGIRNSKTTPGHNSREQ